MEILKRGYILIFFFSLIFCSNLYAARKYLISDVIVNCNDPGPCTTYKTMSNSLKGDGVTLADIKSKAAFILNDNRISKLIYRLEGNKKKAVLFFDIETKLKISRLEHKSNIEIPFERLKTFLPVKEGAFLNESDLKKTKESLIKQLEDKGFGEISIDIKVEKRKKSADVLISINIGKIIKLKSIKLKSVNGADLYPVYGKKFSSFLNESWDRVNFKVATDELAEDLIREGFYFSNVKTEIKSVGTNSIEVVITIIRGTKVNFSFNGQHILSRNELLKPIVSKLKSSINIPSNNEIKKLIDAEYKKRGLYDTEVDIRVRGGKLDRWIDFKNYFLTIKEGEKLPVSEIIYRGNIKKGLGDLRNFYYSKATPLAARDYLDESFVNQFPNHLKQYYLKNGFVSSEIETPVIEIDQKKKTARIIFKIIERQQVMVDKIILEGIPHDLAEEVRSKMTNKVDAPLNIVSLSNDLETILEFVRNKGYFYAQILNLNQASLVQYSGSQSKAKLHIKFNLEKRTLFKNVLITGNVKTKDIVISREVEFKDNDIVTPQKLEKIKTKLSSLGLFSLIRISPYLLGRKEDKKDYHANILIQVREKEFGYGEFAPGIRTDLGLKTSVTINYNNVMGLNHSHSLKVQANQRLNTSTLDANRSGKYPKELEGLLKWTYNWPYFAGTKLDFDFSTTAQRRRYFGFDADIIRLGPGLSRRIADKVTVGLKYQFETISQFNATAQKDSDFFRIGSLTPSISLDLRDNVVNPRSGAYFGLSMEIANPGLFSLQDEDLEVNYTKLVSRNKFYFSSGMWTYAFSLSAGVEQNNARDLKFDGSGAAVFNDDGSRATIGYIPSIKVFRLDGVDTVRGFSDSEINLVENRSDIGEIVIQDKAYFVNFKFEPRYLVSDTFMWGMFFDAGRVFVDDFKPLNLRTSTGFTFKLLTPVGSLDFDYGIKLKRETKPDLSKESFGRFHLSIGYF